MKYARLQYARGAGTTTTTTTTTIPVLETGKKAAAAEEFFALEPELQTAYLPLRPFV
jgi:hypothetical protein